MADFADSDWVGSGCRVGSHTGVDDLDGGQLTVFVSAQVNRSERTGTKMGQDLIAADFPRVWIGEGLKGSPYRDHPFRLGVGRTLDLSSVRGVPRVGFGNTDDRLQIKEQLTYVLSTPCCTRGRKSVV